MSLQIEELRKLCTDDTIIMTAHVIKRCKERNIDSECGEEFFSMAIMKEIEKLSKQAEKIISEVMIIDYNKAA